MSDPVNIEMDLGEAAESEGRLVSVLLPLPFAAPYTYRLVDSELLAPTPTGTACCIKRARSATKATASENRIAPAQTKAVYSPKL